jgi:hypothetical protein
MVGVYNGKVINISNIIIVQKANTKSNVGQHRSSTNAKVELCAMEQ